MKDKPLGHKTWVVPGCCIPGESTGEEPYGTSRDEICILNTGNTEAALQITIFYTDRDPIGPYPISVAARRTRHVRFNDLIDPEAIPLDREFAAMIASDKRIIVQFNRLDTSKGIPCHATTMAFPIP